MSNEQTTPDDSPHKNKPSRSAFSLSKIRIESIFLVFMALSMILVAVLSALKRLGLGLKDSKHSFLVVQIGRFLDWIIHFDADRFNLIAGHETLWIGFLGAIIAVVTKRHLGLSTTHFMKPGKLKTWAERYSLFIFICVGLFLVYASVRMIVFSYTDQIENVGQISSVRVWLSSLLAVMNPEKSDLSLKIPQWWITLIFPLVLSFIVVRLPSPNMFESEQETFFSEKPKITKSMWFVRFLVFLGLILAWYIGFFYEPLLHKSVSIFHKEISFHDIIHQIEIWKRPIKYIGIITVMVAFLLGTPIFVALGGIGMLLCFSVDISVQAIPLQAYGLIGNKELLILPLITFAGYLLAAGRFSERLIRLYKSLLGWIPGGLGVMVVLICTIFTTYTGASGVTILALGGFLYPLLLKEKYSNGFSLGLVTASSSLGMLFPPSLPVILYAASANFTQIPEANLKLSELYLGGLIPGLIMVLMVCLYTLYQGIRSKTPRQKFEWKEVFSALWDAKWDLLVPIIILVPSYLELLSITESISLGVGYTLLLGLVIKRDIHPIRDLPITFVQASSLIGAIVILLGMAAGLTKALNVAGVPTLLLEWIETNIQSRWALLLALNVFLLIFGSILEVYSAILLILPLIIPLAVEKGINPIHLGVMFLTNLELGMLLPPVGLNLLLASNRFKKPLPYFYKQIIPFLLIMATVVLLITYVEPITTIGLKLPALWSSIKSGIGSAWMTVKHGVVSLFH